MPLRWHPVAAVQNARRRAARWLAVLCWLPGIACAHGGPCADEPWLASAAVLASMGLSLLAVLVGPILVVRLSPGGWGWRMALGVLANALGWTAVVLIAAATFVMGQGCADSWTLAGIYMLPALGFGGLLLGLRVLRNRLAVRTPANS